MSDGGYTLVEMLAALAIIGLAFGGLSQSANVLARLQLRATSEARGLAHEDVVASRLGQLLDAAGPFSTNGDFVGQPTQFEFTRGGEACQATLQAVAAAETLIAHCGGLTSATAVLAGTQFRYGDASGLAPTWPPPGAPGLTLKSVSLVDTKGGGRPLATARLTVDEPATCLFDVVAQACRAAP